MSSALELSASDPSSDAGSCSWPGSFTMIVQAQAGPAGIFMQLTLCLALLGLLIWAAATDLVSRIIPHSVPIALVAMWLLTAFIKPELVHPLPSLLAAAATFCVGFAAWRCGYLGGGDVKLLAALALWTGGGADLIQLALVTALLGGGLAILWLALERFASALPWFTATLLTGITAARTAGGRATLPYGLAIAGAGGWLINHRLWP